MKLGGEGKGEGEYENPDKLARSGRHGGGNYEPTGRRAPYDSELPVSKSEAPVYATADEATTTGPGKIQPT